MEQLITLINANTAMAVLALPFISMFLFKITAIFKAVSSKVTGLFSFGINADENDRFHQYLYKWLSDQKYVRVKNFKIDMPWEPDVNTLKHGDLNLNPINGTYYCKVKGLPLFSVNSRVETNGNTLHKIADLKIFTFSRKKVEKLVNVIMDSAKKDSTGKVFSPGSSNWWNDGEALDTEFYANQFVTESSQLVFDEVDEFLQSKDIYLRKNLKYRKGILLHGIPGSGKSTLAGQIAAKYGMNLYVITGNMLFNAGSLLPLIPHKSIVVFEDFDLSGLEKRKLESKEKNERENAGTLAAGATASLLNALDGLVSMNGSLLIATTNRIEDLDSALIRPGRFDTKIEMNELTKDEQEMYIAKFYDMEGVALPEDIKLLPIANLASMCTDNMNDYDKLIETLTRE